MFVYLFNFVADEKQIILEIILECLTIFIVKTPIFIDFKGYLCRCSIFIFRNAYVVEIGVFDQFAGRGAQIRIELQHLGNEVL